MTIERLTSDDFATFLSNAVNERDRTLDTRIGPFRDIFIDPPAGVFQNQNDRVYYLNKLISLKNADQLVPDDVDDLVYNDNIVRYGSVRSSTVVTFSRSTPPVTDITVPLSFPVSTKISATTGRSILFKTSEEKTMYAASASQYYNSETGKYELDVSVVSTSQGSNTAVPAYNITELRRALPEFDEIFNRSAATDGSGIETNDRLAKRYLLHVTGSQISTPDGLKSFVLDNFSSVTDAAIVYDGDTIFTRSDEDPGAVDAWVLGDSSLTRSYTTEYYGVYTTNVLDKQPLVSVTSVTSVAAAASYFEGTDYEVVTGDSVYSYSVRGSDGIRWLSGGNHPDIGDDLTITYTYNSLIAQLQSFFGQISKKSRGSDVLFKAAIRVPVTVEATLTVNAGSPTNVQANVRTAIKNYINSLMLGDNLEEFDIDREVGRIYGVDNFVYTVLDYQGGAGIGDLVIEKNQYARIEESDLVINLA